MLYAHRLHEKMYATCAKHTMLRLVCVAEYYVMHTCKINAHKKVIWTYILKETLSNFLRVGSTFFQWAQ